MKKIILVLLFPLSFSCNSEKNNEGIVGNYYFNNKSTQIFQFDYDKLIQYNIIDSNYVSYSFNLEKNNIFLDNLKYKFNNFNNDSIIIYNYNNSGIDISLVKFDFYDFDVNELNNSDWELKLNLKEGKKLNQFFKIKGSEGIHFFEAFENDTLYFHKIPFKGKYFNKFNVYSMSTILIPLSFNDDHLSLLDVKIDSSGLTRNHFLNNLTSTNEINPLLLGKWKVIRSNNFYNSRTIDKYIFDIEESDKDFDVKIDSIEKLLDYKEIEFTSDYKFFRHLEKSKISFKYNLGNSPISKFIFIENPDFNNDQFFEVKKLTNDSLTIKISEPSFIYNYVRDSI